MLSFGVYSPTDELFQKEIRMLNTMDDIFKEIEDIAIVISKRDPSVDEIKS
jgi:hypothetical protein